MLLLENKESFEIDESIFVECNMQDTAFFDIETTGFDKEKDTIILISLGYFDKERYFTVKQYYAENIEDEKKVLNSFLEDLNKFDKWCSYNGLAFDEPFVKKRMEINNINFSCPLKHIDLYRLIKPHQKQIALESCKLKSVEKYIGIERKDKIDGGMSIELYYEFLSTKNEKIKEIILLHNYEDVLNLPKIYNLAYKICKEYPIELKENLITEKQLGFLKSLLKRNKMNLNVDLKKISKRTASKLIDSIIKGNRDKEDLMIFIINDNNNVH
ncbi:MAG: ribonuclease H-like domain-containing protein [Bacillota bacterium]|nr:ribonuclease H-like domain-containing protein [Bacillota bacterium]